MRYFIIIFCVYNCAWAQPCPGTNMCFTGESSMRQVECGECEHNGYGPPYLNYTTNHCVCGDSPICNGAKHCLLSNNITIQCQHCAKDGYGPPYNSTTGCRCGAVDYVNDGAATPQKQSVCNGTKLCLLQPPGNMTVQCGQCVPRGYGPPYNSTTNGCICGVPEPVSPVPAPPDCSNYPASEFDCTAPSAATCCRYMGRKCCGDPGGEPDANCVPAGDSCGPLQSTVADLPPCHQCLRGWSAVDRGCDAVAYNAAKCQQCCEENGCTTCPSQAPAVAATTDDLARTYGVAIGIPLGSAVVFAFGYTFFYTPRQAAT